MTAFFKLTNRDIQENAVCERMATEFGLCRYQSLLNLLKSFRALLCSLKIIIVQCFFKSVNFADLKISNYFYV